MSEQTRPPGGNSKPAVLMELVEALLAQTPETPAAESLRHRMESLLMNALGRGGREAGEALVESLAARGHTLKRLKALPCMWRVELPAPRVLEIWFTGGDNPVVAAVSYRIGEPYGSRKQQQAARLQAEFYRRFEALAPDGDALAPDDRLILRVGEFEADVNNGGFSQYLVNKGEARARETLAALTAIGAKRTARWLTSALEKGSDEAGLARLDQKFSDKPEDLAALAMTHIRRDGRN